MIIRSGYADLAAFAGSGFCPTSKGGDSSYECWDEWCDRNVDSAYREGKSGPITVNENGEIKTIPGCKTRDGWVYWTPPWTAVGRWYRGLPVSLEELYKAAQDGVKGAPEAYAKAKAKADAAMGGTKPAGDMGQTQPDSGSGPGSGAGSASMYTSKAACEQATGRPCSKIAFRGSGRGRDYFSPTSVPILPPTGSASTAALAVGVLAILTGAAYLSK